MQVVVLWRVRLSGLWAVVLSWALVFPERRVLDFELRQRFFGWLVGKGKQFYRAEGGEEVNIEGQLLRLLPRVQDAALKGMIEEELNKSVS
jgi:hypothetical protein